MGMDRNTLIGFGLIGALLITMFVINSKSRLAYEGEQKRIADSIAALKPVQDTTALKLDIAKADSTKKAQQQQTGFEPATTAAQVLQVHNDVMTVTFSTKGAQPVKVVLNRFKKADGTPVVLQQGNFNKFSYTIIGGGNRSSQTDDIFFVAQPIITNADKTQTIVFNSKDSSGKELMHQYIIRPGDYMMDLNISFEGVPQLFTQNTVNFLWQSETEQVEKDHKYELTQTHITYNENGNYDFEYVGSGDDINFKKRVNWIAVKQQFFVTGLIAKNMFNSAAVNWLAPADSSRYITRAVTNATYILPASSSSSVALQFYYGPSDYNILKKYDNQMENIVPYGSGVFAFVKYINRYFLLPVFDFLQKHVASMGIVILLLTLLIRLITSPILYKSYLSGAKMKLLKPEVDELKAKYKDDQQAFGMEQMKLWRSAGVSPLGGCLPALLQIPIFMSLYYFFQSNIDLRGKSFLWTNDLAAYDSIYNLPFSIPFYGDHVSLFTITATLTSLLISIYSMSSMQDNSNPVMKYMPYIFPVLLLGVFNTLPSALTWYYTVSNTITLLLQIVIQKYIINHDKITARMAENRKKPVKKSKMQERIEAMQESQKKIQDMKKKPGKK
ncbi:MAG: membrane protein insertase YidC [Gloeobacteraceae cyanobacterium ES-bin-316]|nr:membrane protein insertase YidC [Ferruginibacter sp.]